MNPIEKRKLQKEASVEKVAVAGSSKVDPTKKAGTVKKVDPAKVAALLTKAAPMGTIRLNLAFGCHRADISKLAIIKDLANTLINSKSADPSLAYRGRTIKREHIIKILEWYAANLGKTVAELVPAGVTSEEISGLLAKLKQV